MGDFQSSPEGLRIEDFQSFDEGFGFLDFLDLIEEFFQPWIKGCMKFRGFFLLRRRACFPSPSARVHAPFYPQLPPA